MDVYHMFGIDVHKTGSFHVGCNHIAAGCCMKGYRNNLKELAYLSLYSFWFLIYETTGIDFVEWYNQLNG
jgi:hypothetical protein